MNALFNKGTILTVIFIAFGLVSNAQLSKKKKAQKDTEAWKYEIECVGIASREYTCVL